MNDFVKSELLMTPAMAGATTTLITGTLISQFDLTIKGKWICLIVSLLFGLGFAVSLDKSVRIMQRVLYFVINWITVFTVAVGLNTAGMSVAQSNLHTSADYPPPVASRGPAKDKPDPEQAFFQDWF